MRRDTSHENDTGMCEAGMKLVYKIIITDELVFARPERIKYIARIIDAVDHSSTWAEFRHRMPRDEYSRVMLLSFDDQDKPRPKGSDRFDDEVIVPSTSEGDYPPHLEDEMFHGILPSDLIESYCRCSNGFAVDAKDLNEIRTEMKRRGYKLTPILEEEMLRGILPSDILKKYGNCELNHYGDVCCWIDQKYLDEIAEELERRGYELIDGSGDISFVW